jgi:hypothetical protein
VSAVLALALGCGEFGLDGFDLLVERRLGSA